MTPAIAVATNRPRVVDGLASQTRRRTRGKAAVVPVTDCFRLCQRPRRSLGPSGSGGSSRPGSPVRPLLAGPVSPCLRRPMNQCMGGGPDVGGIIPIVSAAYRSLEKCIFNVALDSLVLLSNIVIMDEKELGSIKGWFAGRLPDGWFTGVEVTVEDDQIVVLGTLPDLNVGSTPEEKEGAAAGRIARFREETRGDRIGIAQEAEERFDKDV